MMYITLTRMVTGRAEPRLWSEVARGVNELARNGEAQPLSGFRVGVCSHSSVKPMHGMRTAPQGYGTHSRPSLRCIGAWHWVGEPVAGLASVHPLSRPHCSTLFKLGSARDSCTSRWSCSAAPGSPKDVATWSRDANCQSRTLATHTGRVLRYAHACMAELGYGTWVRRGRSLCSHAWIEIWQVSCMPPVLCRPTLE